MNRMAGYVGVLAAGLAIRVSAQEETVSRRDFEALQTEVSELTAQLNAQKDLPKAEPGQNLEMVKAGLPEGFDFSALFEMEAGYSSAKSAGESDIKLATVELGAGWQMADRLRGGLVFLYEEDDTEPMEVDQATVTLGNTEEFPLFMQAGKMYVPFGNLESFFVSDPIVLELAETRETAALIGFEKGGFSASASAFNGDAETDGENQIENAVLAASYGIEGTNSSFNFGAAWIRNMMDSDGLTGVLEGNYAYTYTEDDTGGFNVWATAAFGSATLIAEYVTALDDIKVDGVNTGLKPSSMNLELGYALTDRLEVAAKYEKADDAADWFAENRYGVVGRYRLLETGLCSTAVALEYMKEDFGAGAEDADVVTAQLAVEF